MPAAPAVLYDIAGRHQVYLEGLKGSKKHDVEEFLKRLDRDIRYRLSTDITDYTRTRLEALLALVRADITTLTGEYIRQLTDDVVDLAVYESGFEARSLNQAVDYQFILPSTEQLRSAVFSNPLSFTTPAGENLLEPFMKSLTSTTQNRVIGEIRLGYYQGESLSRILQRIRGTRANGFRDGIISRVGRDAEFLARTALQHAANQARQEVWDQNSDIVKSRRWVSVLDSRTSSQCQALDGRVFPLDSGPVPPLHIGCRSTTIGELDERYKWLPDDKRTRVARDSGDERKLETIPANQTYFDWLKKQPVSFQNKVLGVKRSKLLRDGGLTSKQFADLQLNRNFQPKTLEQMKADEPVMFEMAGVEI